MAKTKLSGYRCERCGHRWLPRGTCPCERCRSKFGRPKYPKVCPGCHSDYWDRQRIRPVKQEGEL